MRNKPCVLTIAGSDSSGGAGIQADIKTISANGCYAASVITALTAQNTLGVQSIQEVPAEFVEKQLESVFSDLSISAVKIGMLHNKNIIISIANQLKKFKPNAIVLDPVMVAKNGCELIDPHVIPILKDILFPLVTLVTPNAIEAEVLLNKKITTTHEQEAAAIAIGNEFQLNVLIKGGHINHQQASDVLYLYRENTCHWFHAERIVSLNTHGTGCSLSSAIAAFLAKHYTLHEAINSAKKYLTHAISFGRQLYIGQGHGPVDHFYFLEN